MFSISQIRAQARQTINSTPGIFLLPIIPVAMTFIWTVFQYFRNDTLSYYDPAAPLAPLFSSFAFPLLYGLLMSFISISLAWTLLLVVRGIKKTTELKDVFAIFNSPHLGKIFVTFLLKQFYLFLWGLIFYVGLGMFIFAMVLSFFFALSAGSVDSIPDESLAVIGFLVIFGLFALIGGLVLFVPQYLAYSQVEYILFDQLEKNEYIGANAVIKASRQMMKGYKGKRFVLDLSFLGWFILTGITFGLAGIYVWPYYYAAQAHFYETLKVDAYARQAAFFGQFQQATQAQTQSEESVAHQTVAEEVEESSAAPVVDQPVDHQPNTPDQAVENKMDSAIDSPIDHQE